MIRFLLRLVVFFLAALVGIVGADLLLSGFSVSGFISYVWVALVFAVLQALLQPLMGRYARRRAPMLTGGIGILSAAVALLLTNLVSGALTIDGVGSWIAAAVLVWLFGALAAFLLPFLIIRDRVKDRRGR